MTVMPRLTFRSLRRSMAFVTLAFVSLSLPVQAQISEASLADVATWTAVDVVTGYETRAAEDLAAAMPGWSADRWGNVVRVVGEGGPRRIVACALDAPGLSASHITDDGYLRAHRIGRGSRHPLWDQAFEAQQVRILTPTGPVAGRRRRR